MSKSEVFHEADDASIFTLTAEDTARGRRYMAVFDDAVAELLPRFDTERGLVRVDIPEGAPGVPESAALLPRDERKRLISPLNTWAYTLARSSAGAIGALAYAFAQPLSRHHGDETFLKAVSAGLAAFEEAQLPSGEYAFCPIRFSSAYGTHEMAWRLECLLTAYFCVRERLSDEARGRAWKSLSEAMRYLQAAPCDHPVNRGMVWTAVMAMCWRATGDESFRDDAARMWERIGDFVFQRNGEINEGAAPCINYSLVSFEYLVRYQLMTGDSALDAVVERSLTWLEGMFTDSLEPFRGLSSRKDESKTGHTAARLLPAFEMLAERHEVFAGRAEDLLDKVAALYPAAAASHGGISWMTAAHHATVPSDPAAHGERKTFVREYWNNASYYVHVRQKGYQTGVVFRGIPEKKGLQIWAAGNGAPFLCTDPDRICTAKSWGFDLKAVDVHVDTRAVMQRPEETACQTGVVSIAHGPLSVTYLFTPETTVVVQTLADGLERETTWRCSERYGCRYVREGDLIRCDGAPGVFAWWGAEPVIEEDGRTIAIRDSAPTQVFAFSTGEVVGCALTEISPGVVEVLWRDTEGAYRALVNHADMPVTLSGFQGDGPDLAPMCTVVALDPT